MQDLLRFTLKILLSKKQRQKLEVIQKGCLRYARQTVCFTELILPCCNIVSVD